MPDDFCLIHGYDHMTCDRFPGAIPYCEECERQQQPILEAANDDWRLDNEDLPRPIRDCGCWPCRGQCRSAEAVRILWCEQMSEQYANNGGRTNV